MAPFSEAVRVTPVLRHSEDNGKLYKGEMDPGWTTINSISNGGYVLALVVQAAIQFQATTPHKDPLHVTAHFLRSSAVGPCTVHVRVVKSGKRLTNLVAELFQKDVLRVTTHMIFGHNGRAPGDQDWTLLPPSPYARRVPLHIHPSRAETKPMPSFWSYRTWLEWTVEPDIETRNAPDHPNRTSSPSIGGSGLEWGTWLTFKDESDTISNHSIPLLADIFTNTIPFLPSVKVDRSLQYWFSTVTLSIEFKAPIPKPSEHHANRTVGIYANGRFLNHPQGRHETYVEIWTAPTNVGEGEEVDGWRDKQVCLAIATQMSLSIPVGRRSVRAKPQVARL